MKHFIRRGQWKRKPMGYNLIMFLPKKIMFQKPKIVLSHLMCFCSSLNDFFLLAFVFLELIEAWCVITSIV